MFYDHFSAKEIMNRGEGATYNKFFRCYFKLFTVIEQTFNFEGQLVQFYASTPLLKE
jgi:hypothetical protein